MLSRCARVSLVRFLVGFVVVGVILLTNASVQPTRAEEKKPAGEFPHYVRLSAEIKGTLHVELEGIRIRVLMNASCLMVSYAVWELDFAKNDELRKQAEALNGKTVVVAGEAKGLSYHEIHEPPQGSDGFFISSATPRQTIIVKSVKAWDAKREGAASKSK